MSYQDEIEPFLKKNPYQVVKVGTANVRYILKGEETNPCVVFLNGGMNCSQMWFKYVEMMSDEYRVLIFDYPIEIKTVDETAQIIHEFLIKLGIEKAFFAGASFGGMMAQIFARKYPQMVTGLGLFSTAGLDEKTLRIEKRKYRFAPLLLWYMKHCDYEKLKPKVIESSLKNYAKKETEEDREYLKEMFEFMFKDYTNSKDIHITGMISKVVNIKPCKKEDFDFIKDKVLLIFPKEDFFSNDEQKSLQDLFPYAKTEYIKNGHFGTVLEYEKYIGLMKEFI